MAQSNSRNLAEHTLVAVEAALSLVPGGGVLATLMNHYIPTTWQLRQEETLAQLHKDMERLGGQLNEQRLKAQDYHVMMVKVIREIIVEPHVEKQKAFRAILLNDAMSPSSNSERDLFIKITEDLTGDHIRILKVLADPDEFAEMNPSVLHAIRSLSSSNLFQPGISNISQLLQPLFPDLPSDHWAVLLEGLYSYGLTKKGRDLLGFLPGAASHLEKRTTPLGDRYLNFITLPF